MAKPARLGYVADAFGRATYVDQDGASVVMDFTHGSRTMTPDDARALAAKLTEAAALADQWTAAAPGSAG